MLPYQPQDENKSALARLMLGSGAGGGTQLGGTVGIPMPLTAPPYEPVNRFPGFPSGGGSTIIAPTMGGGGTGGGGLPSFAQKPAISDPLGPGLTQLGAGLGSALGSGIARLLRGTPSTVTPGIGPTGIPDQAVYDAYSQLEDELMQPPSPTGSPGSGTISGTPRPGVTLSPDTLDLYSKYGIEPPSGTGPGPPALSGGPGVGINPDMLGLFSRYGVQPPTALPSGSFPLTNPTDFSGTGGIDPSRFGLNGNPNPTIEGTGLNTSELDLGVKPPQFGTPPSPVLGGSQGPGMFGDSPVFGTDAPFNTQLPAPDFSQFGAGAGALGAGSAAGSVFGGGVGGSIVPELLSGAGGMGITSPVGGFGIQSAADLVPSWLGGTGTALGAIGAFTGPMAMAISSIFSNDAQAQQQYADRNKLAALAGDWETRTGQSLGYNLTPSDDTNFAPNVFDTYSSDLKTYTSPTNSLVGKYQTGAIDDAGLWAAIATPYGLSPNYQEAYLNATQVAGPNGYSPKEQMDQGYQQFMGLMSLYNTIKAGGDTIWPGPSTPTSSNPTTYNPFGAKGSYNWMG